jgi:hypothetical protein
VSCRAACPRLAGLLAAARPLLEDKAALLAACQRIGPDWY